LIPASRRLSTLTIWLVFATFVFAAATIALVLSPLDEGPARHSRKDFQLVATGRAFCPDLAQHDTGGLAVSTRTCWSTWWGGQDLNLEPTDYESAALTH
jgi:hypothetical protein